MATDYNKLKVVDLKAELKRLGLPQHGLKAELVARLEEAAAPASPAADSGEDVKEEMKEEAREEVKEEVKEDVKEHIKEDGVNGGEHPPEDEAEPAAAPQSAQDADAQPEQAAVEPVREMSPAPPPEKSAPAEQPVEPSPAAADLAPHAEPSTSVAVDQTNVSPPASFDAPPLPSSDLQADSQKRKRRSLSPPLAADDVARKRARQEGEDASENAGMPDPHSRPEASEPARAAGQSRQSPDVAMSGLHVEAPSETYNNDLPVHTGGNDQTDVDMQDQASTYDDVPMANTTDADRDVEPSIHPATSAIYIKNFMRPLRPQAVRDHLLDIAAAGSHADEGIIVDFYLDLVRTHAFVVFNSTSAAARVRTALHNRVWPDETNRKVLWVDFFPPERFADWVDMESSATGRRGSSNRFDVIYDSDRDGFMTARLEDVGVAPLAGPPPSQSERRPSIPTGPSRPFAGIENAPRGPRGSNFQPGPGSGSRSGPELAPSVHPSRMNRLSITATQSLPAVPFQEVPEDLVQRRIEALQTRKKRDYDYEQDFNKEYKRYFFERGDVLVDRGPEIFLGLRPPAQERRRRQEQMPDNRRRGGNGRGRRGGRGNFRRQENLRVPVGGDRFRPGEPYEDRYGDRYRSDNYSRG